MFNNKVGPDEYQELRTDIFNFVSNHKMTIIEAKEVLVRVGEDLQKQICSGIYGVEEPVLGEEKNPS